VKHTKICHFFVFGFEKANKINDFVFGMVFAVA